MGQRDAFAQGEVILLVHGETINLNRSMMLKIFDPVIDNITSLIMRLYNKSEQKPEVVLLTGGLSQSPRLRMQTKASLVREIGVNCPEVYWDDDVAKLGTAVCRGAVHAKVLPVNQR